MTNDDSLRALPPVDAGPGVLVPTSADRQLATEHWLLATLDGPYRNRARLEWQEHGVALLPLGTLFSAVRLPGRLVEAAAGHPLAPADVDTYFAESLDGGPVNHDPHGQRYYALVPATMPATWKKEVDDWRVVDVDCLGRGTYLGVPRVTATRGAQVRASYWSVPIGSAALLCAPLTVARLIAGGRHRMSQEPEA
ncbi:hypothetical protein [Streptomyces sp. NPDC004629]|uniref:hypothetical protein n=1 Tax=Streptomyces sp. NPDC004629 TaxID=3364705 RepID=UPI003682B5A9